MRTRLDAGRAGTGKEAVMKDIGTRHGRGRNGEGGAALFVMVVSVMVASAISIALVTVATGRKAAVDDRIAMESALSIAEAGLARALAEANLPANRSSVNWPADGQRINNSNDPIDNVYDGAFSGNLKQHRLGEFEVVFNRGNLDGVDNDGDGVVDNIEERDFVIVTSTGYRGSAGPRNRHRVRIQGQFRKTTSQFQVPSAVYIDDPTPSVALGAGNSWYVSGRDHDMTTGNQINPVVNPLPGIATSGVFSPADVAEINNASTGKSPQITGGTPAYQMAVPVTYDMAAIVQWAKDNVAPANKIVGTGTNPGGPFGVPPGVAGGPDWQITLHDAGGPPNMVKFTGGSTPGAGIWVIDGDVEMGGNFNFTGIVIVTGQLYYRGGGDRTFLGGVVAGKTGTIDNFDINGNASIKYSAQAVAAAANATARYNLVGWRKLSAEP